MKKMISLLIIAVFVFSGCTSVRTYTYERERVDQKLASGNRGYFQGKVPAKEQDTDKKRTMVGIDIETPFLPWDKEEKVVSSEYKIKRISQTQKQPVKKAVTVKRTKVTTVSSQKNKPAKVKVKKQTAVLVKGETIDNEPILLEDEQEYEYIK